MPEDPANTPAARRGRRLFWLLIGAVVLLPIGWLGYLTFGPNPPIRVSKETTHITAPLAADGLPDYAAALTAELSRGVTPANNAAVAVFQAMLPTDFDAADEWDLSVDDANLIADAIGIDALPPTTNRYSKFETIDNQEAVLRWLREPNNGIDLTQVFDSWIDQAAITTKDFLTAPVDDAIEDYRVTGTLWRLHPAERAWKRADAPPYADWLEQRSANLDAVVTGLKRPRWYLPEASWLRGGRGGVSSMALWRLTPPRVAMRALTSRALLSSGEGRHNAAAADAIAIMTLARHVGDGPFFVDHMVAQAIGVIGLQTVQRVAQEAANSVEVLKYLRSELKNLGTIGDIAQTARIGERFFALDFLLNAVHKERDASDLLEDDSLQRLRIDWNPTLISLNQVYDRALAAAGMPYRPRREELALIAETIQTGWNIATQRKVGAVAAMSPRDRADRVAEQVLAPLVGNFSQRATREVRVGTQRDLTLLLLAAAIHRADTGEWPDSLDDIDPKVLGERPTDTFNGLPYVYRRTAEGVLLYSLGENGVDDGGSREARDASWESSFFEGVEIEAMLDDASDTLTAEERAAYDLIDKIPEGADDVSLRVPLPVEPWPWE